MGALAGAIARFGRDGCALAPGLAIGRLLYALRKLGNVCTGFQLSRHEIASLPNGFNYFILLSLYGSFCLFCFQYIVVGSPHPPLCPLSVSTARTQHLDRPRPGVPPPPTSERCLEAQSRLLVQRQVDEIDEK